MMSEFGSLGQNWWVHYVRDWVSWLDPPRQPYRNKLLLSTCMQWIKLIHKLANTSFPNDSGVSSNAKVFIAPHAC